MSAPLEMPDAFSKATKSTKSKSLARRAIGYLPAVADAGLTMANAANAAGFISNPHLKAALQTANTIKKYVPAVKAAYNKYAPVAKAAYGVVRGQRHSLRR